MKLRQRLRVFAALLIFIVKASVTGNSRPCIYKLDERVTQTAKQSLFYNGCQIRKSWRESDTCARASLPFKSRASPTLYNIPVLFSRTLEIQTAMESSINNLSNFFVLFVIPRAIFKYDDKAIVHFASGTDYEEFRSNFGG